jgi:hypothetical protein
MLNIEIAGANGGLRTLIIEYNHCIQAAETNIQKRQIRTNLKRVNLVVAINRFASIYRNLDGALAMTHWEVLGAERNLILNLYAKLPRVNLQLLPEQERNTANSLEEAINGIRALNIVRPPAAPNVQPPQQNGQGQNPLRKGEANLGIWVLRNTFFWGGAAVTLTGAGNIVKGSNALKAAEKITEVAVKKLAEEAARATINTGAAMAAAGAAGMVVSTKISNPEPRRNAPG